MERIIETRNGFALVRTALGQVVSYDVYRVNEDGSRGAYVDGADDKAAGRKLFNKLAGKP